MTKASHALTPFEHGGNLTIEAAADAVLGLINSSPHSPRRDEITAILSKVAGPAPTAGIPAEMTARWRSTLEAFATALREDHGDKPCDDFHGKVAELTREIWNHPARTVVYVQLLVDVAQFWNEPLSVHEARYPQWVIDEGSAGNMDDYALAKVVEGVQSLRAGGEAPTIYRLSPDALEFKRLIGQYLAALAAGDNISPNDPRHDEAMAVMGAAGDSVEAAAQTVWAKPVRSWSDVVERAIVASHYNIDEQPPDQEECAGIRSLQELLAAVTKMAEGAARAGR